MPKTIINCVSGLKWKVLCRTWSSGEMNKRIYESMGSETGGADGYISDVIDYRIFLNWNKIRQAGLGNADIPRRIVDQIRKEQDVVFAAVFEDLANSSLPQIIKDRALMGYYPGRSGDIIFIPRPGYYEYGSWSSPTGTTHGEWNPYDAHIPCLFYGWKVPKGATSREVHITDIAATVCQLLHIQQPDACTGEPITEITK